MNSLILGMPYVYTQLSSGRSAVRNVNTLFIIIFFSLHLLITSTCFYSSAIEPVSRGLT